GGGRQRGGQEGQQAGCGPADREVGFAVAAGDGDAGRCPGDQPLAGAGQSGVGGVNMQALAVSAQVPSRVGSSPGAGGDAGEPFVDGIRGNVRGQVDVAYGRELSVGQVDGGFVGPAAAPEAGRPEAG